MKRALSFLLIVILVMSLMGCQNNGEQELEGYREEIASLEAEIEDLEETIDDMEAANTAVEIGPGPDSGAMDDMETSEDVEALQAAVEELNNRLTEYETWYETLSAEYEALLLDNETMVWELSGLSNLSGNLSSGVVLSDGSSFEGQNVDALVKTGLREVIVDTVDEFLAEISSNTHIILGTGIYNLTETTFDDTDNPNIRFEESFDGMELMINNVENLIIEGQAGSSVQVVVEPRYSDVLTFNNCEGIGIENLIIGHTIEQGECAGGVLEFNSTENIAINNSLLYGCGTYGIKAFDVANLLMSNSIIEECTYGIMELHSVSYFDFVDCEFRNNDGYAMIYINYGTDINFKSCAIKENNSETTWEGFITVIYGTGINFIDTVFTDNVGHYFIQNNGYVTFPGCEFYDNAFRYEIYNGDFMD